MVESLHLLDAEKCKGDGICVDVCPEKVLEIRDSKAFAVDGHEDACILCGQCIAVCPNEALRMPKLLMEDFDDLGKPPFTYTEFLEFLRQRRSVRVFSGRPVEREDVERILAAAATAPMALPPHSTEVTIIDQRGELDFLLKELVKSYDPIVRAFSSPIGRVMVRLSSGAENYGALKDYIVELAARANDAYRRNGEDRYMRGAPMLMLFHGNRRALSYEENAHLICNYAMLAALSLGFGSTIIGLIPPIVDRSKALRQRYGIPAANKVVTSLILGHPKYKYKKSIRRQLAGVQWMGHLGKGSIAPAKAS